MRTIYIVLFSLLVALTAGSVLYSIGSFIFGLGRDKENKEMSQKYTTPTMDYLKETNCAKYFVIHDFTDDVRGINFLLNYAEKSVMTPCYFVTNSEMIHFDDGGESLNNTMGRYFFIVHKHGMYSHLRLNSRDSDKKIVLNEVVSEGKTKLSADFDTINVSVLQHFIDYSDNDLLKCDADTYTYELYDRHGNKRVKQVYYRRGERFTFDIIDREIESDESSFWSILIGLGVQLIVVGYIAFQIVQGIAADFESSHIAAEYF